jgi:hypothetical protein
VPINTLSPSARSMVFIFFPAPPPRPTGPFQSPRDDGPLCTRLRAPRAWQLEEIEGDISRGGGQSTKVLRALPTPMLSDVQAIYDETKMRSESLAQLVFQRVTSAPLDRLLHRYCEPTLRCCSQTAEVDRSLQGIAESRGDLRVAREALERDVSVPPPSLVSWPRRPPRQLRAPHRSGTVQSVERRRHSLGLVPPQPHDALAEWLRAAASPAGRSRVSAAPEMPGPPLPCARVRATPNPPQGYYVPLALP